MYKGRSHQIFTKYRCVRQHDAADCGAATLATICQIYQKGMSITKIRDVVGTDIKGTNVLGIVEVAKTLRFDTRAVRVVEAGLRSGFPFPAIAHILNEEGLSHFVVFNKR